MDDETRQEFADLCQDLRQGLQRHFENIAVLFQKRQAHIDSRFDRLDARIDRLEARVARLATDVESPLEP